MLKEKLDLLGIIPLDRTLAKLDLTNIGLANLVVERQNLAGDETAAFVSLNVANAKVQFHWCLRSVIGLPSHAPAQR